MAYKYTQGTSYSSWFTVNYDITPDFSGNRICIGDQIKIKAQFTNYSTYYYDIEYIFVYINDRTVHSERLFIEHKYDSSEMYNSKTIDITIELPPSFNEQIIGFVSFGARFEPRRGGITQVKKTHVTEAQTYNLIGSSYDISISDFSFERASLKDAGYVIDNQGKNLICKDFLISVNDDTIASDFQIKKIKLSSGSETIVEKDLDLSVLESAMSVGYSEISPSLFEGYEFELTKNYRIDLTLGNENEVLYTKSEFIYSGYANLHLSGTKRGGVAIGGFSTSTDDNPLFESYFPASFYQGLTDISLKMFGNAIYPVGAIFICNGETDPNITFGGLWERLDGLYLRSSIGEVGKTGGDDTISKYITHRHVAPIGVRSGYMGAISLTDQSNGTEVFEAVNQKYATAKVDSTGKISGNIEFYYTDEYNGSISIPMNPKHLNVAMWERKELYNIETDPSVPKTAMAQVNMKRLEAAK